MNRYAIIENGKVINTVVAVEPMADNWVQSDTAGIGWDYDGENFTPAEPVPEPAAPAKITRLAFRNRFTFAERVAVETAGDTDAAVRVLLKDQEAATFIELSREDTQQGVQLLVSKNLLTAERAAVILDPVVQPGEAFQG